MEHSREEDQSTKPHWLMAKFHVLNDHFVDFGHTAKQLVRDDPRRLVHALKVALTITLISLFYYFQPLFEGFGVAAMWAVLTVVVVFEFSVGATLGKGVNRVLATVFGALLGVGTHSIATLCGHKAEPYIIAILVFSVATVVTFLRFFPKLKARYDYGLMITILTFSLISVSGFREEEVLEQAHRRMSTILIGSSAAFAICTLICPVWAGTDLHNLTANSVEKLGNFLQEFGAEYFKEPEQEQISDEKKQFLEGFKSILNSKTSEDSLVNFARWEPRHGRFRYRHPWGQYQKIGTLCRECACTVEAINRYLQSDKQAPAEVKEKIEEVCKRMSTESGKALKELSKAMKNMRNPPKIAKTHLHNSQQAAKTLDSLLQTRLWSEHRICDVAPAATVASLLLDAVSSATRIADSVQELAKLARFKKAEEQDAGEARPPANPGLVNAASTKLKSFGRLASGYHVLQVDEEAQSKFPKYKEPSSLDLVQQSDE